MICDIQIRECYISKIENTFYTLSTTIKFHPHSNVTVPNQWLKADKSSLDRWNKFVRNNRVHIRIASKFLKKKDIADPSSMRNASQI